MYLRENAPELNLHASTQSSITSWKSVEFWKNLGAKMTVLAREVSIADMKIIKEKCPDVLCRLVKKASEMIKTDDVHN